jgi:gamma-glutamylcyclotransferase (GGCT)/AIG2-like uncharacterized protein YtfP
MTGDLNRFYFAYGSNMSPVQMSLRCPGAVASGIALLKEYRFVINSRGVATIAPDSEESVRGVLWSISEQHEKTLDGYEGVASGHYYKKHVSVITNDGNSREALAYIDPVSESGSPREGYLDIILTGATHFELPESYVSELKKWEG